MSNSPATSSGSAGVTPPQHVATGVRETPSPPLTNAPALAVNPAALGLAAFALTTFVLSFGNAGIIAGGAVPVVFGLALFYGGVTQILAGLWEFAQKNTFGATAFCSYGAFWMSFWYLETATDLGKAGSGLSVATGTWLLAWAIFTLYMTFAAWRTNMATFLVFVALTLTFFALSLGDYSSSEWLTRLGGWLGIITALLAWYTSFAVVINSTFRRVVLPVGPSA
ncbi:acetate uptake transporter [Parafrigoribacterium soli]|uniref:acetate uptake transporter n=1 Tax=Parafrigoribacterium soli TaxID=3144663 RepID=UPI0032EC5913